MRKKEIQISKYLSYVLRHNPGAIELHLDNEGWAIVDDLIKCAEKHGKKLNREIINEVVANNDKKRFGLSIDGSRIRANQGHSIDIELGLEPLEPPQVLYHGTAKRFLEQILTKGLLPSGRNYVHLSTNEETAIKVGQRHGKPAILKINASHMFRDGYDFYCSANGVWLTNHVPASYLFLMTSLYKKAK